VKFDPKSPLPRSQQVRDQVIQFKGLNRMKTKQFTSMDRFKEMIQIEKEFGPVNLGHDPDDPTVKPRTTTSTNIRRHRPNRSPEESSSSQELSDDNLDKPSLWSHLAVACLNETPGKFKTFIGMIEKSTIEKYSVLEMKRKKIL
jgi:hypothetical protein